jgi:SecD/SecF fusion protein
MNVWIKSTGIGLLVAMCVYWFCTFSKKNEYDVKYVLRIKLSERYHPMMPIINVYDLLVRRLKAFNKEYTFKANPDSTVEINIKRVADTLFARNIVRTFNIQFRELYDLGELVDKFKEIFVDSNYKEKKTDSNKTVVDTISKVPIKGDMSDRLIPVIEKKPDDVQLNESAKLIQLSSVYDYDLPTGPKYPAELGMVAIKDTAALRIMLESDKSRKIGPQDVKFLYGRPTIVKNKAIKHENILIPLYCLKTFQDSISILDGSDIQIAEQSFDTNGRVSVMVYFKKGGSEKFKFLTQRNIGHAIAILLDDTVITAPNVASTISRQSIQISGSYSVDEARALANALNGGLLPAKILIESEIIVPRVTKVNPITTLLLSFLGFAISAILAFFLFTRMKRQP